MYGVQVKPAFERSFDKLTRRDKSLALRLRNAIESLRGDPRPPGCKKLRDAKNDGEDLYRIRVGDYRILYVIRERQLVILLVDARRGQGAVAGLHRSSMPAS